MSNYDPNNYNQKCIDEMTEFEKIFPMYYVNDVRKSYILSRHNIGLEKVVKMCKKKNLTYSQYQRLESVFLSKLDRRYNI